jgi:hypothetical protein
MGVKESLEKAIMDKRTLVVVIVIAILWRTAISLDKEIALWESMCSGVALFIMGWTLFGYLYHMSLKETSWLISNKMFQGIAVSLCTLNAYVLVYYGMRWYRLMSETEAYMPMDYLLRNMRYAMLVLAYCGIIWSAGYLKKMHDNYMLITKEIPEMHKGVIRDALFKIITDERTVIVIIGIAFLWRTAVSLDKEIVLWESMCSGVALFIMGWVLFGYISSLTLRVTRPSMMKIYQGIAIALCAINIYSIVYYGMRWYRVISMGEEVLMPLDFLFRDVRYFMLVIFYCTAIVLSKYLEKASEECEFLIKKESEA